MDEDGYTDRFLVGISKDTKGLDAISNDNKAYLERMANSRLRAIDSDIHKAAIVGNVAYIVISEKNVYIANAMTENGVN